MANNRAAIRSALKAMLLGHTDANQNVFTNRHNPLWQSELPAINITSGQESTVPESLGQSKRYFRTYNMILELRVEDSDTADDILDAFVTQVENVIDTDRSLSGNVQAAVLLTTDTHISSDGEKDIALATLTFECKYLS